ncbi:DUF6049 family protein [Cellulomonas sp. PhB143]|uniref:DUF6049 family protein n=1 Tax=Cellulomonas sp. PhB143 TaxID=2485186 RepID=UPI000F47EC57|nr:DUF6049 family protein [Cellulomonas sp. PhB143]ROS75531.1 hypothetical protein EDF32_1941 [Cellulomonas sp. PhB143]
MTAIPVGGAMVPRAALALVVALLACVAVLLPALAPGAVASPRAAASPASAAPTTGPPAATAATDVTVTLTKATPDVLTSGHDLTVTAVVRNGSDAALETPTALLGIDRNSAAHTRDWVAAWDSTDPDEPHGREVTAKTLKAVPAGGKASVTFKVSWAQLGLGRYTSWGAQGLAVVVSDAGGPVAAARTFVVWDPETVAPPTVDLSVAVPVVGPPSAPDDDEARASTVAAVAPGSRLDRVLAATQDRPQLAWAADPALVDAAHDADDAAATSWVSRLQDGAGGRDLFALPAFDPDVSAYAHAGVPLPADRPSAVLGAWRTDLAWPVSTDATSVTTSVRAGRPLVVSDDGTPAAVPGSGGTPSARDAVGTTAGDASVLVADPVLGTLVGTASEAAPDAGSTPLVQQRRLMAETATIAAERPSDTRHVLVTLPRDWDPDPTAADAALDALTTTPWVTLRPVEDLLAADSSDDARAPLPQASPDPGEISTATLRSLARKHEDVAGVAAVVDDPAALTAPVDRLLVAPTSVAFRGAPATRDTAVDTALAAAQDVVDGVQIVPGSTINLITDSGGLPVRVRNDLPQDATVTVVLTPDDPRLRVGSAPTATVAAGTEQIVEVAVTAVGSGNISAAAHLEAADGAQVGADQTFDVRLRAAWATVGTAVIAALLGLLLVAGVWRSVRRGRASTRAAAVPHDPEDPR